MSIYAGIFNLNAVDVFMALVIAMIIFIGAKEGIVAGLVKLLGVVCLTVITLHYYVPFADYLRAKFFGKDAETEFFAFSLLAIPILAMFALISRGWVLILKIKLHAFADRWGGVVLSLLRSYLLCGLIFLAFLISKNDFAEPRARQSVSRYMFGNAAAGFYEASYASVIKKFFPGEEINEDVFKLLAEPSKKNRKK